MRVRGVRGRRRDHQTEEMRRKEWGERNGVKSFVDVTGRETRFGGE